MSPVSQVRDPGHVTKVTRFGPYFSLRGRLLKGKGKAVFGKGVLGARETRGARVVSRSNSLPLPFRTPATQAILTSD